MAMKDVLTEQTAENAYLVLQNYAEVARAEAYYRQLDDLTDSVKAEAVMKASGDKITEKKVIAALDQDYISHLTKVAKAREDHLIKKFRHDFAVRTVDWWRTVDKRLREGGH